MKKIAEIENAYKAGTVEELNITYTFYWAYWTARERKNQTIDLIAEITIRQSEYSY